jgi:hypothetical protein
VRLRGRDPDFVVTPPPASQRFEEAADSGLAGGPAGTPVPPAPDGGEGGTSRITLRLPEHLKPRIDDAAGQAGLSVNAWLVRAVSAALEPDDRGRGGRQRDRPQTGRHYSGWVR